MLKMENYMKLRDQIELVSLFYLRHKLTGKETLDHMMKVFTGFLIRIDYMGQLTYPVLKDYILQNRQHWYWTEDIGDLVQRANVVELVSLFYPESKITGRESYENFKNVLHGILQKTNYRGSPTYPEMKEFILQNKHTWTFK
jgi:hypothetical protein